LSKLTCRDCVYGDACTGGRICDDFDPIVLDGDGSEMDTYIESRREAYRRECFGEWLGRLFDDEYSNCGD
jgi:hypothetical protein